MKLKRFLCVCMLCVLCTGLTACSPYDAGDKVTEFTTELERKFTEYREVLKVKFDELTNRYNVEKDNVETLIKDRNLDKPNDNVSDDVSTEEVVEDVSNIENWDSSLVPNTETNEDTENVEKDSEANE